MQAEGTLREAAASLRAGGTRGGRGARARSYGRRAKGGHRGLAGARSGQQREEVAALGETRGRGDQTRHALAVSWRREEKREGERGRASGWIRGDRAGLLGRLGQVAGGS